MRRNFAGGLVLVMGWVLLPSMGRSEFHTITFQGWQDCIELSNETARVVAAPAVGGRILHYSRDGGPNFLWEDPRAKGDTLDKAKRGVSVGGYQCDIGPELESPLPHPPLWVGRYEVEKLGPLAVRVTSAKDEATGIQMIKEIALDRTGAAVTVNQIMKNAGEKEASYCLWDRTMSNAEYAFFAMNPNSRFPAHWSVRQGERDSYSYDGKSPSSPRVQMLGNLLVTVPGQKTEKVGADSQDGWVAGFRDGWLYVKKYSVVPGGDYADGGNTVELWVDAQKRTEIEPLGPKVKLAPGATSSLTERWDLRRVEVKISGAADIPNLLPIVRQMAPPQTP